MAMTMAGTTGARLSGQGGSTAWWTKIKSSTLFTSSAWGTKERLGDRGAA